jgi:hypothetical protein
MILWDDKEMSLIDPLTCININEGDRMEKNSMMQIRK